MHFGSDFHAFSLHIGVALQWLMHTMDSLINSGAQAQDSLINAGAHAEDSLINAGAHMQDSLINL
jgi:hypothetical protein